MEKVLGGERLGTGKKIKVDMHGWGRSTFNQSRIWRSTMAPGVLTPCFTEIGTNGTTFDIDINTIGHTIPTISPLFGAFKMQIDLFACPMRLYQGVLHNNATNIGMQMDKVKMPAIRLQPYSGINVLKQNKMHSSSLNNFLGIRGTTSQKSVFWGMPHLAYYDIFKNYYSNKQEDNAKVIVNEERPALLSQKNITIYQPEYFEQNFYDNLINDESGENQRRGLNHIRTSKGVIKNNSFEAVETGGDAERNMFTFTFNQNRTYAHSIEIKLESTDVNEDGDFTPNFNLNFIELLWDDEVLRCSFTNDNQTNNGYNLIVRDSSYLSQGASVGYCTFDKNSKTLIITFDKQNYDLIVDEMTIVYNASQFTFTLRDFPLSNIDEARNVILKKTELNQSLFLNTDLNFLPYNSNFNWQSNIFWNKKNKQGLVVKTYLSDLYNNWLSNDYVDLINNLSSVQTNEEGNFTIDALILAKKVYNVLNRIAVSGGTYHDWQEANWGEVGIEKAESPIYIGGLSAMINFEEVVSTAQSNNQPLATLGGKGVITDKKGGNIIYKCQEPTIIMGIASITPLIDYHQGNKWFMTNLETMNDLHKPGLDGIGFQNIIANNVVWSDSPDKALAKQPAWINYQTAVNEVYGQFAEDEDDENPLYQMVLRRNYETDESGAITDFTTYIDPSKYNTPFAVNGLDSENFWIQIGFKVSSRRKMGAYEIPNL